MIELWITLGLIAWFLLSIPLALFLGRTLKHCAEEYGPEIEPVYLPHDVGARGTSGSGSRGDAQFLAFFHKLSRTLRSRTGRAARHS